MNATLEERLIANYQEQARWYERALEVLKRQLLESDGLDEFNDVLQIVAALDNALKADKAAWRQSGLTPSDSLRGAIDQVATRIRALSEVVDGHVAALVERKTRLLPEMDAFCRARSMLNAYSQYRQGAARTA
jgi:hypothetical protein